MPVWNHANCFDTIGYLANTVDYFAIDGWTSFSSSEAPRQITDRAGNTWANLLIYVTFSDHGPLDLHFRINGVNSSNLLISVPDSSTGEFEDVVGSDTVTAGDEINFELDVNGFMHGDSGAEVSMIGITEENTTGNEHMICTEVSQLYQFDRNKTDDPRPILGGVGYANGDTSSKTEADMDFIVMRDTVLSNMQYAIESNTMDSNVDVNFRVDAADGNQVVTITAGTTGIFEDTTNSDTLADGDAINVTFTSGTSMAGGDEAQAGCGGFLEDSAEIGMGLGAGGGSPTQGATYYFGPNSQWTDNAGDGSEANVRYQNRAGSIEALNMYATVDSSSTTGDTVYTLRIDGVDTDLTITIGSGVTGQIENITDRIAIADGEDISIEGDHTSSGALFDGWRLGIDYREPQAANPQLRTPMEQPDRSEWVGIGYAS